LGAVGGADSAETQSRLRRLGYLADPVERWLPNVGPEGKGIRRDLWHFGDVLAVHPGRREFLIVQATSLPNVGARVAKAKGRPELALWLAAGGRFEVHGWAKRSGLWVPKVVEVRAEDLADVVLEVLPRKRRRSPWHPRALFADTVGDDKDRNAE
jgi:hypothetical protein